MYSYCAESWLAPLRLYAAAPLPDAPTLKRFVTLLPPVCEKLPEYWLWEPPMISVEFMESRPPLKLYDPWLAAPTNSRFAVFVPPDWAKLPTP